MSSAGANLTLGIFLGGLVLGLVGERLLAPAAQPTPYAALPPATEPSAAAIVVAAIIRDDARGLAKSLDQDVLKSLGQALEPIVEVTELRFVGATELDGRAMAAYIAKGRDLTGEKRIVGFVLRVQDDQVVGVN